MSSSPSLIGVRRPPLFRSAFPSLSLQPPPPYGEHSLPNICDMVFQILCRRCAQAARAGWWHAKSALHRRFGAGRFALAVGASLLFPFSMFWNAVCLPLLGWFGHGLDGGDVVDVGDLRQGVAVALLGAELLQLGAGGEDALPLRSELPAAVLMGFLRNFASSERASSTK